MGRSGVEVNNLLGYELPNSSEVGEDCYACRGEAAAPTSKGQPKRALYPRTFPLRGRTLLKAAPATNTRVLGLVAALGQSSRMGVGLIREV
jgi:hypothetical protein